MQKLPSRSQSDQATTHHNCLRHKSPTHIAPGSLPLFVKTTYLFAKRAKLGGLGFLAFIALTELVIRIPHAWISACTKEGAGGNSLPERFLEAMRFWVGKDALHEANLAQMATRSVALIFAYCRGSCPFRSGLNARSRVSYPGPRRFAWIHFKHDSPTG